MQNGVLQEGTALANLDMPTAAKFTPARSLQEFTLSQAKGTLAERIKSCQVALAFEADQNFLSCIDEVAQAAEPTSAGATREGGNIVELQHDSEAHRDPIVAQRVPSEGWWADHAGRSAA